MYSFVIFCNIAIPLLYYYQLDGYYEWSIRNSLFISIKGNYLNILLYILIVLFMDNLLAQIIGFGGTALTIIAYQQNKRKKILLCTVISAALFAIHYIILGAYTGAIMNILAASRSLVFMNNTKKWAKSKIWVAVFMIVYTVACVLTWDKWYSVLPLIAMLLTTVSNWFQSEKKIRFLTFPSSPCWLVYNVLNGSFAGVITEIFVMSSLIIAIIRL